VAAVRLLCLVVTILAMFAAVSEISTSPEHTIIVPTTIIYHTLAVNNPAYSSGTYYLDLKMKLTIQIEAVYNDNTES